MKASIIVIAALMAATAPAFAQSPSIYTQDGKFLGTLGGKYDNNSVNNPYGQYGNPYAPNSIKNAYGPYGNPYSQTSPRNPYASSPPVILAPSPYGYSPVR